MINTRLLLKIILHRPNGAPFLEDDFDALVVHVRTSKEGIPTTERQGSFVFSAQILHAKGYLASTTQ